MDQIFLFLVNDANCNLVLNVLLLMRHRISGGYPTNIDFLDIVYGPYKFFFDPKIILIHIFSDIYHIFKLSQYQTGLYVPHYTTLMLTLICNYTGMGRPQLV